MDAVPELTKAMSEFGDADLDLHTITDDGVEVCLQHMATMFQATVASIVIMKNNVTRKTGTANVGFQQFEL